MKIYRVELDDGFVGEIPASECKYQPIELLIGCTVEVTDQGPNGQVVRRRGELIRVLGVRE